MSVKKTSAYNCASFSDPMDQPVIGMASTCVIYGNSFNKHGTKRPGYAIALPWGYPLKQEDFLPPEISTQKVECPHWALQFVQGKRVNKCSDFKYAFLVLHVHMTISEEGSPWQQHALKEKGHTQPF